MKDSKNLNKIKLSLKQLPVSKYGYYWFILPIAIIFIALVCGSVYTAGNNQYDGFANVGIDFQGGTVLTVEMNGAEMLGKNRETNLAIIKSVVESHGASVASDQDSGSNTLIVRYPNRILGEDGVVNNYNSDDKTEDMIAINRKIADDTVKALKQKYGNDITVNANPEMINATASSDLITKALLSVGIAMLLMLIYICIRFNFFSGIAAFIALFHDVIVMLALVIIFRIQINSSLIACIITIVAYSINNTIVIFDRVRENMAPYKHKDNARINIDEITDRSVSESLTRALFTSMTTLITIVILAAWGVQSLTEFALPIIFGIVAGLYSSVFLAPALWGFMMKAKQNKQRKAKKAAATRGRRK